MSSGLDEKVAYKNWTLQIGCYINGRTIEL